MFNKLILSAAVLLSMACIASAQDTKKPCGTDDHYRELIKTYPQLADLEAQFAHQLRQGEASKTTSATDTTTYDIPFVVHVIHDYGSENISDNIIYDAVRHWSEVYTKQNADTIDVIAPFVKWIGNPRMRLHLATIDPTGNPTKGVVRTMSYLTIKGGDQAKYDPWPNDKYINVWLISTFSSAHAGAAAYAYYPSLGASIPYYDGIISLSSYADYDKTIPHEFGHVLNLQHVWGNTNNAGVACGNDGVDDTPPTKGHNPSGCGPANIYDTTCSNGYMVAYPITGMPDSIVNYPDTNNSQNIMDYTYCEKMFTIGQAVRMRTALLSSTAGRNNLVTASNLAATGALAPMPDLPPVADFIVNRASGAFSISETRSYFLTINNPALFVFRNASWNDTISSVAWTFSSGAATPTSASTTTVANQFSVPGWVTVSLQANSNAGSTTVTDTHAVFAADTTAINGYGYTQSFPDAASVDNWPMFNFYKNAFQWEYYSSAGYDDDFYTQAFDLTHFPATVYLNFQTAAASVSASTLGFGVTAKGDSLEVDVSTTGGQRWFKIAGYTGNDLSNNGVVTSEFVPTSAGQWKARAITIDPSYLTGNTFFRFRYWPGNTGNNMYLDNVSTGQFPAGVQESYTAADLFSIFPNPTTNGFSLVFKTGNDGVVNYAVRDITGKLVYEHKTTLAPNTMQQEAVSRTAIPAAGMYFITVTIDGVNKTQKLVVY